MSVAKSVNGYLINQAKDGQWWVDSVAGENIDEVTWNPDQKVIYPVSSPLSPTGGVVGLNHPGQGFLSGDHMNGVWFGNKEASAALKKLPADVGVSEGIKLALKALTK